MRSTLWKKRRENKKREDDDASPEEIICPPVSYGRGGGVGDGEGGSVGPSHPSGGNAVR